MDERAWSVLAGGLSAVVVELLILPQFVLLEICGMFFAIHN